MLLEGPLFQLLVQLRHVVFLRRTDLFPVLVSQRIRVFIRSSVASNPLDSRRVPTVSPMEYTFFLFERAFLLFLAFLAFVPSSADFVPKEKFGKG
jgi:hypothetical protein